MKKIMRRFSFKIVRKSRRAISVIDRAQKGLEEARARLQPVKGGERTLISPTVPKDDQTGPAKPAPPAPGALPPGAPIFTDNETAPFTLKLGDSAVSRALSASSNDLPPIEPSAVSVQQSAAGVGRAGVKGQQ